MGLIVGIDEVGRGAWAGPITAGVFVAEDDWTMEGLDDSKKLGRSKRRMLGDQLRYYCKGQFSVVDRSAQFIDEHGIDAAWASAIEEALGDLKRNDVPLGRCRIVVDGNVNPLPARLGLRCEMVPKADGTFPVVMAASVLAKTHRDAWMRSRAVGSLYGFGNNAGYGTPAHIEGLEKYGACELHRKSFEPIKKHVLRGALRKHLLGPVLPL